VLMETGPFGCLPSVDDVLKKLAAFVGRGFVPRAVFTPHLTRRQMDRILSGLQLSVSERYVFFRSFAADDIFTEEVCRAIERTSSSMGIVRRTVPRVLDRLARKVPKVQEVPRPQMYLFGELEGGFPCLPLRTLRCSWRLVFDSSWWVIQGDAQGETHVSDVSTLGTCTWNHPIMVHMAGRQMQGWPRLQLTVRGADAYGRQQFGGYGMASVPMRPGTSELRVRCWRPVHAAGFCGWRGWRDWLLGVQPELERTEVVSDPTQSRTELRTEGSVEVFLRLSIVHQHFGQNGIET